MKSIFLFNLLFLNIYIALGQDKQTIACIAFYNFENLFDTIDSPDTDDLEFTPNGPNLYNSHVYYDKLSHLARVISEVGTEYTPDGPAILGASEIENVTVLQDLVRQPAIASRGYRIIHQDSKDARGVDVALLYQPKYFQPQHVDYFSLTTNEVGSTITYSRDILIARGNLNGEPVLISVNHWPSRRGGEQMTAWLRIKAASWNRQLLDSLQAQYGITKTIVMGDLNDDPVNDSVKIFTHRQVN